MESTLISYRSSELKITGLCGGECGAPVGSSGVDGSRILIVFQKLLSQDSRGNLLTVRKFKFRFFLNVELEVSNPILAAIIRFVLAQFLVVQTMRTRFLEFFAGMKSDTIGISISPQCFGPYSQISSRSEMEGEWVESPRWHRQDSFLVASGVIKHGVLENPL